MGTPLKEEEGGEREGEKGKYIIIYFDSYTPPCDEILYPSTPLRIKTFHSKRLLQKVSSNLIVSFFKDNF
jgi:hypothetical protein